MKKLLLLSTIFLISSAGYAVDVRPYVEGRLNQNWIKDSESGMSTFKDSAVGGSLEVGAKIDQFRVGLEGFYNDKAEDTINIDGLDVKASMKTKGLFLNAYYDIPLGGQFKQLKPYVGAGLGYTWGKIDASVIGVKISEKGDDPAWNVGAGVAYGITDNTDVTLGYRFEKLDFGHLENHKVSLGLRYTF